MRTNTVYANSYPQEVRAAIYCRLSKDDDLGGPSASIQNQRELLCSYCEEQGWRVAGIFQDDGYTGLNMDRPDFQRMLGAVERGMFDVILTKDLSRLGRNYLQTGQLIEEFFPKNRVRYIALNDAVDSNIENDITPFRNILNEFYSRDTSKKVKAVKKACAENGKYMGTYPPIGYKRDPLDKHHFIIDEETAPLVCRIFAMRASGMAFRKIATTLNAEGVQPPGELYYQRQGRTDPRRVNHLWNESTVKVMIRNEAYIGNMVQGKCGTLSYKSKKLVAKPKDQWIRVEGTHEPIISREIWDTVVSIDQKKVRKSETSDGIKSIFTGLVYCADCGFKMRNQVERFTYKDGSPGRYSSFMCGSYSRSGKSACTIHTIYENVLTQIVLEDIREKARYAAHDRERLLTQIIRMKDKEQHSRAASYEQELKVTAARVAELEKLMQNLYEDKCAGVVPPTVFQTLMKKYETERAQKAAALPELEQKVRTQLENRHDADQWAEIIRRYTEITELDETILFELVDRIEVGEAQKCGNTRIQDVKVFYRYVGCVDNALSQERRAAV